MKVTCFGTGQASFGTLLTMLMLMFTAFVGTHAAYFFAKQ
jgi:hypothetical protein